MSVILSNKIRNSHRYNLESVFHLDSNNRWYFVNQEQSKLQGTSTEFFKCITFSFRSVTGPGGQTTTVKGGTTGQGGATTKPSTSSANTTVPPMTGQYVTGAIILLAMHVFTLGVWIQLKI